MKTLFLTIALSVSIALSAQTQTSPGAPGANTGGSVPSPASPVSPVPQFNGTNPAGEPNQSPATQPQSTKPGGNYQPTVQPNPVVPTTPAVPNMGTNPYKNINRLFQDPSRTPSEPKTVTSDKVVDGSRGKYHRPKKAMSGKTFAHNRAHVKTSGKSNSERTHAPSAPTK